jgi:hypothetical protein
MNLTNRKGQVTTEYILLVAFLVTLIMAISGILNTFVERAGDEIQTRASAVMSQRQMGIPLSWFFASVGGQLPDAGNPGGGGGGGPDGGGDRPLGPDTGGDDGGGGGPDGGPGGDGGPAGGPGGGPLGGPGGGNDSPGGQNNAGNTGNNNVGADGEEGAGPGGRAGRRGTTGGVVVVDDDADGSLANQAGAQPEVGVKDDEEGKGSGVGADGGSRREYALTNQDTRRRGTCEDFDIFRLLKILAIVALVVLGGAYLMSASGNRGGHKK